MLFSPGKLSPFPLAVFVFLAFTSELFISPVEGLKCYECQNCSYPINPTNCKPMSNRCEKVEEGGFIWRHCSQYSRERKFEKMGFKCDEHEYEDEDKDTGSDKRCYCDTDYCNQAQSLFIRLHNSQLIFLSLIIMILIFQPV
ncbi:hypothetical protein Ocin01_08481 [Orchesella cincta]|uniref:Protein sleepless n=1 Tax=Orchesella cincta TaxID=48709 RepID=A0A1D2MYR9_ORCCI|nr:hypothetical protein Ocin01_08481 [Orchesella cincta]